MWTYEEMRAFAPVVLERGCWRWQLEAAMALRFLAGPAAKRKSR